MQTVQNEVATKVLRLTKNQMETVFDRVVFAAAKSVDGQYQSILEGVDFWVSARTINVCATDGSRLVHFQDGTEQDDFRALVPASAIVALRKQWRKKTADDCLLTITSSAFTLTTVNGSHAVDGNLIAGEYPRYFELFPVADKNGQTRCELLDIDKVDEHCERIAKLCKALDYPGTVKLAFHESEAEVKLSITDGYNKVSKDGYTTGVHYSSTVKGSADRGAFECCFNPDYLADALKNTNGLVSFTMQAKLKPAVFQDTDKRIRHLLMPIQAK